MENISYIRKDNRKHDELRKINIVRNFNKYAEGSVLIEFGETKVICTASIEARVPPFLKDTGKGWITAEYGMLPRSTAGRMPREAAKGKQTGRTVEIQRIIGRSLRSVVNLDLLNERTITIDCDVIQADGGTRTAAITGSFIALCDAVSVLLSTRVITQNPVKEHIAAVSIGKIGNSILLDLDYEEDSNAEVDMNFVLTEGGSFVELQGTGEESVFSADDLSHFITLARLGSTRLIDMQKNSMKGSSIFEENKQVINPGFQN